jgi:hypothetical protein
MEFAIFIIILIVLSILAYGYFKYQYPDMTYVKSDLDNQYYLVQNNDDKQDASNLMAKLRQQIILLSDNLYENKKEYPEFDEYIELLNSKVRNIVLVESTKNSAYTSYSVNKGEQIIFCLRTKTSDNHIHDMNLIMYVVLHEISHVACPIYDGHGPLFRKIFNFLTLHAIKMGIYKKIEFDKEAQNYCGMQITDSIV